MKALIIQKFGSPKHLLIKDVNVPFPAAGEVLVRVRAASVNAADIEWMKGLFLVRFMGSSKRRVLGSDMAGTVDAVGAGVTRFKPGDEVMADLYSIGMGAFSEYVCVSESDLREKPESLSFEQAATIPQAGVCALQGIKMGRIETSDTVLINGAGGGMGSFAIQLAKSMGAKVTGVDRADKFDLMRGLGATECMDYKKQAYTQMGSTYDFILDMNADKKMSIYERALKPGGVFVVVGGKPKVIMAAHIAGSRKNGKDKHIGLLMWKPNDKDDITQLADMTARGVIKPAIDRVYPFSEAIEAIRYCWEGNAKGKVVISMNE